MLQQTKTQHPLSIFTSIKRSLLPTIASPARLTVKTFSEIRYQHPDKINASRQNFGFYKFLEVTFYDMSFDAP